MAGAVNRGPGLILKSEPLELILCIACLSPHRNANFLRQQASTSRCSFYPYIFAVRADKSQRLALLKRHCHWRTYTSSTGLNSPLRVDVARLDGARAFNFCQAESIVPVGTRESRY